MVNYYKRQVEIARDFGVSEGTVTNWIKGAEDGKNNLQLTEIEGKKKILKNEHNRVEMINLADNGKKFRPDEDVVELEVSDELYEIMDSDLLISFINNLILRSEIPYKFSFIGNGANLWSNLYSALSVNDSYGYSDLEFLWKSVLDYLEVEMANYDKINLVDIGPGNFFPSDFWVKRIVKSKKFGYYIPIDLSTQVLETTVQNFLKLHDSKHLKNFTTENKLQYFRNHSADLDKDSLDKIVNNYKDFNGGKVLNIFIFLGGTIGNLINVERSLQNIKDAMSPNDFLIIDNFFDNVVNRTVFPIANSEQYDNCVVYIPKLLGLVEGHFEREYVYDDKTGFREFNLILKQNFVVNFKKLNLTVNLKKNSKITIWKHRRASFNKIFQECNDAGMALQAVIKHPINPEVIYISKPQLHL